MTNSKSNTKGYLDYFSLNRFKVAKGKPKTCLKSSPMGRPPSCSMGVISSDRYSQMWGMSIAMSSATSRISWSLMTHAANKQTHTPCTHLQVYPRFLEDKGTRQMGKVSNIAVH